MSDRRSRRRILWVGLLVATPLLLEGLARAILPRPLDWREDPRTYLEYDARRGWALKPGATGFTVGAPVRVNSAGFRDREFETGRVPGVTRIACVGDSYIFGWGVALDESFPKQLESKMRRREPIEVLNLGVGGQDAHQARLAIELVASRYRPDLVIYGMYWDDLIPTHLEKLTPERFAARLEEPRSSPVRDALRSSRALYFAVDRLRAVRGSVSSSRSSTERCRAALLAGRTEDVRELWESQCHELVAMKHAARAAGAELLVVAWPLAEQVVSRAPACRFIDDCRSVCDRAGVPMISMLEPLREAERAGGAYLPYEAHPSSLGYDRCAARVADLVAGSTLLHGPIADR